MKNLTSSYSEILCHVCLGSGEHIRRNYLFKEVGRETCYHCHGTGNGMICNITGELIHKQIGLTTEAHP
jgi:DnaJ-class molecular chaperone